MHLMMEVWDIFEVQQQYLGMYPEQKKEVSTIAQIKAEISNYNAS